LASSEQLTSEIESCWPSAAQLNLIKIAVALNYPIAV
jgi:hypothetical protein